MAYRNHLADRDVLAGSSDLDSKDTCMGSLLPTVVSGDVFGINMDKTDLLPSHTS